MLAICNISLTKLKMITVNKCSLALILEYQHPLGHYERVLVKLCHFICVGFFFFLILIIEEIEI